MRESEKALTPIITSPTASLRCLEDTLKGRGVEFRLGFVDLGLAGELAFGFFAVRLLVMLFSGGRILLFLFLSF